MRLARVAAFRRMRYDLLCAWYRVVLTPHSPSVPVQSYPAQEGVDGRGDLVRHVAPAAPQGARPDARRPGAARRLLGGHDPQARGGRTPALGAHRYAAGGRPRAAPRGPRDLPESGTREADGYRPRRCRAWRGDGSSRVRQQATTWHPGRTADRLDRTRAGGSRGLPPPS